MLIVPSENIRKYVAYSVEDGGWIHDPKMPGELVEEFEKFKKMVETESTLPITEMNLGGEK